MTPLTRSLGTLSVVWPEESNAQLKWGTVNRERDAGEGDTMIPQSRVCGRINGKD